MIYQHLIINTHTLAWDREPGQTAQQHSEHRLDQLSQQGWELVSALSEHKFVLRKPVQS